MGMHKKAKEQIEKVREYMKTQTSCPKCGSQYVRLVEGMTDYATYTCVPCRQEFKVSYERAMSEV